MRRVTYALILLSLASPAAAADLDFDATLFALRRAEVRLEVAAKAGHTAAAAH